jgi:hypothetical protein
VGAAAAGAGALGGVGDALEAVVALGATAVVVALGAGAGPATFCAKAGLLAVARSEVATRENTEIFMNEALAGK